VTNKRRPDPDVGIVYILAFLAFLAGFAILMINMPQH